MYKLEKKLNQLLRYAIVGFLSNLVSYLFYLFITYIGTSPKITMSVLYGIGATISFFGNRTFTFSHNGSLFGLSVRYIIVYFFGYLINLITLIIFVDKFMYPHQYVQAVAIFVVAGFLFISLKLFVFTNLNMLKDDRL